MDGNNCLPRAHTRRAAEDTERGASHDKKSNDGVQLALFLCVSMLTTEPGAVLREGKGTCRHAVVLTGVPNNEHISVQHVVSYSISAGSIVNVVTFASKPHLYGTPWTRPWVEDCLPSEVLECYHDWEPEVEELLQVGHADNIPPVMQSCAPMTNNVPQCIESPTRWAIHEMKPLPFFVAGSVVLLGDAVRAHLTPPIVHELRNFMPPRRMQ